MVGALGLNILVGYTGQISIGHGAFMSVGAYTAANLVVRLDLPVLGRAAGGRPDGGRDRRGRRHPVAAHQGPLPRDRDARRRSSSSSGPSTTCRGSRGGVQASIEVPPAERLRPRDLHTQTRALLVPALLRGPRDRRHHQPGAQPDRPRLRRHPRPGHRRRDHRHRHLPLQAARLRASRRSTPGVTGVLYTYYLGIANYEQFQITVSIDYLAMIIIGGLGSVLGLDLRRHLRHPAADREPRW